MKFIMGVLVLCLCSCQSFKFKKEEAFNKDSDFLKNGNKVEAVELSKPKKKPVKVEPKKIEVVQKKEPSPVKRPQTKIQPKLQQKKEKHLPFYEGEKVVLSARYFGVEAGKVTIGVKPKKKFNGQEVYHFYAHGKTNSVFSFVYRVEDRVDALWGAKEKRPLSLAFDVNESKQRFKIREYFDWDSHKGSYFEEGWHKKRGNYTEQKNWKLPKLARDIVSSLFYVRLLDLRVGSTHNFNVMEDEKLISATVKVDRKEVLSTRVGKFNTLVVKPHFRTKGKFKKVGDISVWLTDDEYKQIVRIETKIKIGTIVASLHSLSR